MDRRRVGKGKPSQGKGERGKAPFGKPAYGKPGRGKPAGGKAEHGKPAHGKPDHGKPAHGKPPHGKPRFGKAPFGKRAEGTPHNGKPADGKPRRPLRERKLDFDDVMYGIHVVEEALAAGEALRGIHVADDRKRDPQLRKLIADAKEREIPVRFEERGFFAQLPFKVHQGVIAIAPPFEYANLHEVIHKRKGTHAFFVILDHLTDPHNVGAIIRTAECAGADAVILPERRSAGVNATVRKAAAGAAEHLPIVRIGNINEAIRALKKAGVWVAGADAGEGSVLMYEADLNRDVALVIGAEGAGLAPLVARECDYLVRVPMPGVTESLNASVAAGVLMYEVLRQRRPQA